MQSRFSDPYLNRFLVPDSIIPNLYNPQDLNRYAYVGNNSINRTDPTGHMACGDGEAIDCSGHIYNPRPNLQSSNTVVDGNAGDAHDRRSKNNGNSDDGEMITTTAVITMTDFENNKLSTKAEESWGDYGPSFGPIMGAGKYGWYVIVNSASIYSDFQSNVTRYSIRADVNWKNEVGGIYIHDVTVQNYSPTFVAVRNVTIQDFSKQVRIHGPEEVVGHNGSYPGIINIKVNTFVSNSQNASININMISVGGFPNHPFISIMLPAGAIPPYGCSWPSP